MKKLSIMVVSLLFIGLIGCVETPPQQQSDSGATKATVQIKTDQNGHTSEQNNVMKRLERDNDLGVVKHLYIISSYTGDVMEYSTVKGKVTSGGKRLSPKTVNGNSDNDPNNSLGYNYVILGNHTYTTDEVLDDGGTYGESMSYVYWFDAQDNYHQYFPSGGTYLHISDKPLRIKKVSMTFEN